jgi:hypothetical protein
MEEILCGSVPFEDRLDDPMPALSVSQIRRVLRDVVLGLEFRECLPFVFYTEYLRRTALSVHHYVKKSPF